MIAIRLDFFSPEEPERTVTFTSKVVLAMGREPLTAENNPQ